MLIEDEAEIPSKYTGLVPYCLSYLHWSRPLDIFITPPETNKSNKSSHFCYLLRRAPRLRSSYFTFYYKEQRPITIHLNSLESDLYRCDEGPLKTLKNTRAGNTDNLVIFQTLFAANPIKSQVRFRPLITGTTDIPTDGKSERQGTRLRNENPVPLNSPRLWWVSRWCKLG